MDLKLFWYSLFRFVPGPGRGEAANLGVVVVSDEEAQSASRFMTGFRQKVFALAPGAPAENIEYTAERLALRFQPAYQPTICGEDDPRIVSVHQLRSLASTMSNQVQLSEPRLYQAASLQEAVEELYERLVKSIGQTRNPPRSMTRSELNDIISRTIKEWRGISIHEGQSREVEKARHYADFWIESEQPGLPHAALMAIPEDPAELRQAAAMRDSIPTIAEIFRKAIPDFKMVAVLPPVGHAGSEFVKETEQFLRNCKQVIVTHADELQDLEDELAPTKSILT